jgi:hypothetical protein
MRGRRLAIPVGVKYGRLTVLGDGGNVTRNNGTKGGKLWLVLCECGVTKTVVPSRIIDGGTASCGCGKIVGIEPGTKLGRLVMQSRVAGSGTLWLALCDCGRRVKVTGSKVVGGEVVSCGCARWSGDSSRTHGRSRTGTYNTWKEMIARCTRPNASGYARYGARGIRVCEQWLTFARFLRDMGERPPGMTIERKRNDRGYNPENCKWATTTEQNRNKTTTLTEGVVRSIRKLKQQGVRQVEIAARLDLTQQIVSNVITGRTYAGVAE